MLRHGYHLVVVFLGQRVVVDEVEHGLEHPRLHVVDTDRLPVVVTARRHRAEELRHEHRRPGGEHAPVRRECLVADLDRDVRPMSAREEAAEMPVHDRRWHGDERPTRLRPIAGGAVVVAGCRRVGRHVRDRCQPR